MKLDKRIDVDANIERQVNEFEGFTMEIIEEVKQFIPAAVRERIDAGQDGRLSEMLRISVVFVDVLGLNLHGVDEADSLRALKLAQRFVLRVQESCYRSEGSLSKIVIDEKGKGIVVQCAFGLPGCYHMDDAARSIVLAKDLSENICRVADSVTCSVGVATGLAFCGKSSDACCRLSCYLATAIVVHVCRL